MDRDLAIRVLRAWASMVLIVGIAALLWPSSLLGRVDYVMVSGSSMEPGMHTGDLVLVRAQRDYEAGDTIAYRIPEGDLGAGSVVIHRVIGGNGNTGYRTQGDNRGEVDEWRPTDDDVLGERWALVPGAGNLVAGVRGPLPLGILAAVLTFVVLAVPPKRAAAVSP